MSDIDNVAYGLAIFKVYGGGSVWAEHDEIFCGPADGEKISEDDKRTLEAMGWTPCAFDRNTWAKFV